MRFRKMVESTDDLFFTIARGIHSAVRIPIDLFDAMTTLTGGASMVMEKGATIMGSKEGGGDPFLLLLFAGGPVVWPFIPIYSIIQKPPKP